MDSKTLQQLVAGLRTALSAAEKLQAGATEPYCAGKTQSGAACKGRATYKIDDKHYCGKHKPKPPKPVGDSEVTLLTADEAAKFLGVHRTTLYEQARNGEIPCRRAGRRFLFVKERLTVWLLGQDKARHSEE